VSGMVGDVPVGLSTNFVVTKYGDIALGYRTCELVLTCVAEGAELGASELYADEQVQGESLRRRTLSAGSALCVAIVDKGGVYLVWFRPGRQGAYYM